MYQSRNGGLTWEKIFDGATGANPAFAPAQVIVTDMEYTVANGAAFTLYVGVGNPIGGGGYNNGAAKGVWRGTFVAGGVGQPPRVWTFGQIGVGGGLPAAANIGRIALAADRRVNQANPVIYAAVSNPTRTLQGVFLAAANAPNAWVARSPAGNPLGNQGDYNLAIAIDPQNPAWVYLGGQGNIPWDRNPVAGGLVQSDNSGQNWVNIDTLPNAVVNRPGANTLPHPDHHALLVVPVGGGSRLFDGNDGGIFRFTPGATRGVPNNNAWVDLNTNIQTNLVNGVATNNNPNPNRIALAEGSQDNGLAMKTGLAIGPWRSQNRNRAFPGGGDGGLVRSNATAADVYYVGNSSRVVGGFKVNVWSLGTPGRPLLALVGLSSQQWQKLTDAGAIANDLTFPFYPTLAVAPETYRVNVGGIGALPVDRSIVAVGSVNVWEGRTLAGGAFQWTRISPAAPLAGAGVTVSALHYVTNDLLLVGFRNGQVWRFDRNAVNQWARLDNVGGATPWGNRPVGALNTPGDAQNTVFVGIKSFAAGMQLFRQNAPNQAFASITGAGATTLPPLPVNSIRIQVQGGVRRVFVGNDAGVYMSSDANNQQWARFDVGLPYVRVSDLQWIQAQPHELLAATYGRGVYHIDVGAVAPRIRGRGWLDLKDDGIQNPGERALANVTVELYDDVGALLRSTTTGSNGTYEFDDLAAGDYTVRFVAPDGMHFTLAYQGGDPARDSDADPATGETDTLSVSSSVDHIDAGLIPDEYTPYAEIGDWVWLDSNGNGIQDAGESGVEGVEVELYTGGGQLVGSTVTAADGSYGFDGMAAGEYYVQFLADGYFFTTPGQGPDPALDSDVDPLFGATQNFIVEAGDFDDTIDAGLYQGGSIGDFVWDDADNDGVQDAGEAGLADVMVLLLDPDGAVLQWTTTDSDGAYYFTDLAAGDYRVQFNAPPGYVFSPQGQGGDPAADSDADGSGLTGVFSLSQGEVRSDIDAGLYPGASGGSIGDYVWDDADNDGIQDGGESGTSGVTVNLLDGLGNWLDSTATDATGRYQFSGLAAGSYKLQFVAPPGYQLSPQDQGTNDSLDSDADASGLTVVYSLAADQQRTDVDAGLIYTGSGGSGGSGGSIGDYVWEDLDGDGIQDTGEWGLWGVTVNLLDEFGGWLASTTTDSYGYYQFIGLAAGNYKLQFVAPSGYSFTLQGQGTDNTLDSDADASGLTAVLSLAFNENRTNIDAGLIYTGSGGSGGSGGFLASLASMDDPGSEEADEDHSLSSQDADGGLHLEDIDALFALLLDEEDSEAELLRVL